MTPVGGHVRLGAGRFHYRMWTAERPAPVTVVLLHGVAGSVASWSRVGPALATARIPALALDLRGHGGSVRPPAGSYGLTEAAGDVADFLTVLGLPAPVLVGHCWGANLALVAGTTLAHRLPHLAGLVLEEPLAALSPRVNARALRQLQAAIRAPATHLALLTRRHWHPADRDSVLDGLRTADPDVVASVVHDGASAGPLLPRLAELAMPTLLLRADPHLGGMLTDSHWSQINELLPTHSAAHHLPGTPHDIHRGNYPAFMRYLTDFLAELARGASHEQAPKPGSHQ
jgi:pimeloyl-ACP methyl ester carboxylesterase